MTDFPVLAEPRGVIGTLTPGSGFGDLVLTANLGAAAGAVWPTANKAFYFPFTVTEIFRPVTAIIVVTTQAGNVDVGLYREDGGKIWSAGTTLVGGVGAQSFAVTAGTVLLPGSYYMAMACSSATAAFARLNPAGSRGPTGTKEQTTAFVLPSPATFADATADYVPVLTFSEGLA